MTRHTPGTVTTAGYEICGHCCRYLSADNPGVELFGRVVCLTCIERIREALVAQAAEDKAREFGNLHPAPKG